MFCNVGDIRLRFYKTEGRGFYPLPFQPWTYEPRCPVVCLPLRFARGNVCSPWFDAFIGVDPKRFPSLVCFLHASNTDFSPCCFFLSSNLWLTSTLFRLPFSLGSPRFQLDFLKGRRSEFDPDQPETCPIQTLTFGRVTSTQAARRGCRTRLCRSASGCEKAWCEAWRQTRGLSTVKHRKPNRRRSKRRMRQSNGPMKRSCLLREKPSRNRST